MKLIFRTCFRKENLARKLARVTITLFSVGICLGLMGCATQSWLHQSGEVIAADLKHVTPLGTQFDTAARDLRERFGAIHEDKNHGFLHQDGSPAHLVGVKSIEIHLGDYRNFPMGSTSVDAYWGFDNDGKLIDIWVWKTTDSL